MRMRVFIFVVLAALLCLSSVFAEERDDMEIEINERLRVEAGETKSFSFSPTGNNLYLIKSFGGEARGVLWLGGERLFDQTGFAHIIRLIADASYTLTVTAFDEPTEVEIMRDALGRSFDDPIVLGDLTVGYDKVLARPYDTHWFRFTAPHSGLYSIRTSSQMDTTGSLLDSKGRRVASADDILSPYALDFRLEAELQAGQSYIVRISARGAQTGPYHLSIAVLPEHAAPAQEITFSQGALELTAGDTASAAALLPPGAKTEILYISTDPDVFTVDDAGFVSAVGQGEAELIALGLGGAKASLAVRVRLAEVEAIVPENENWTLHEGQRAELAYRVEPEAAGANETFFVSANPAVVSVDENGAMQALGVGVADVTIACGRAASTVRVEVLPRLPVRRALLVGEQSYQGAERRLGAVNTTQGLYDLLARQRYEGSASSSVMRVDLGRVELIEAIRNTFADAISTDISLLYINCHGELRDDEPFFRLYDGTTLSGKELYKALSGVPGRIVLLIDCCNSGGIISKEKTGSFHRAVREIFSSGSATPFARSKYFILTSASHDQLSYRMGRGQEEGSTATAFSYYLAIAGGWDLVKDGPRSMRGDLNGDGRVTLWEAHRFVSAQVSRIMNESGYRQDVQIWPEGSSFVLFERSDF